jgi:hypothetical protein
LSAGFQIVQATPQSKLGLQFYGGAREFWRSKDLEILLEGPYETGKTIAALTKLHTLLCKYPNSRAFMTRKTYKSLVQSAVVTYEKKVLPFPPNHPKSGITKFGGERPEHYDYPNGSRLICFGLDSADKALSSEYDFGYINQLEEVTLHEYEQVITRLTGRAGNAPYTQLMSDCNPGPPTHWILQRQTLRRFRQLHEHNPSLFNQRTGQITEQGTRSLAILDTLTGIRYKRGRKGLWVAAEGQVYENYDPDIHLIAPFKIPSSWRRYRVIDFGYVNPFVCQWWAVDGDGRLYLYREIYMTGRTVRVHAEQIKQLSAGERIEFTPTDHDAEDRATLRECGIATIPAKKDIRRGIQVVEDRLKVQGDGDPRLFIFRDALVEADPSLYRERPGDLQPVCTEQEFSSYVWAVAADGKPKKEVPVDMYNHGMDCVRYICMALHQERRAASSRQG